MFNTGNTWLSAQQPFTVPLSLSTCCVICTACGEVPACPRKGFQSNLDLKLIFLYLFSPAPLIQLMMNNHFVYELSLP